MVARSLSSASKPLMPEVSFSEDGQVRHLHLGTPWIQGSMRLDAPFDLELDYVQRMMAWLLFQRPEGVPGLHAMQLGLGAGALTKFCLKKLRMRSTVIEINPRVLQACRVAFKLPPESERFRVILADASREIAKAEHLGAVDALQVDLYDHEAAAPALDSADFYAGCRGLLADGGVMTVNLFGRNASFEQSLARMADAFGKAALWRFSPTREGNTVVLAQREPSRPPRPLLIERAHAIESRWGLPAGKWLRLLRPCWTQAD
ncbi:MAG: spermidine synthase [Betaproteobacteria bacterium]